MDVERVYRVSARQQFYRIHKEELQCNTTTNRELPTEGLTCPPVFDHIMCWMPTKAGTTAVQPCPSYIDNFRMDGLVTRRCTENGTWFIHPETQDTWTNFSGCMPDQSLRKAVQSHLHILEKITMVGYAVSSVSLVLAIMFLLWYKFRPKPKRTISKISILHINLFISYFLRAVTVLLKNSVFKGVYFRSMDEQQLMGRDSVNSQWECKLITASSMYSLIASTFWLSVEAYVLLRLIVNWKYLQEKSNVFLHIAVGWGGPFLLVLPWTIFKITAEDDWCWVSFSHVWPIWAFIRGPIILIIIINDVLFIKIVMFLYQRLRKTKGGIVPHNKSNILVMARYLCILIPLFGVPDIVFVFMSLWFDVEHLYAELIFNSFQGCMLSSTLCFAEKKVIRDFWQILFRCKKAKARPADRRISQPSLSGETTV